MKLLITGGTGLLGWRLVREALKAGHEVIATYHKREPAGIEGAEWVRLDLTDAEAVKDVIKRLRPEAVIHSAAYTDVDGCERNQRLAYVVNYLGTLSVARTCSGQGCSVIYVSTDYVFDGEKRLYGETDTPRPINYYGLSKLLGEAAVLGSSDENVVVRVSGLYGYSPTGKRNFGITALQKLLAGEEVRAFADQYLSPTYVPFLAERLIKLLSLRVRGILHIAGERSSRYEFALALAERVGARKELVVPVSMSSVRLLARRPRDSSLDTSRATSLGLGMPRQRECIDDFVKQYLNALDSNR